MRAELRELKVGDPVIPYQEDKVGEVRVLFEIFCDVEIRLKEPPEPNVADGLLSRVKDDVVVREGFVGIDVAGEAG